MTTWADVEIGTQVIHNGTPHKILVLKPGGQNVRVVLENLDDGVNAKVAVRAKLRDKIEMPDGAEKPDKAGKAIVGAFGAVHTGVIEEDGVMTFPMVNITTVASHLKIIHGIELAGLPITGDDELLRVHQELHDAPFHEPMFAHTHEHDQEA